MNTFIIHKIALYLNDVKKVKQLFYIDKYREYVMTYDEVYDELNLKYGNENWFTNDLKQMISLIRLIDKNLIERKNFYDSDECIYYTLMDISVASGNLEIVKWLHIHGEKCTYNAIDIAALNGYIEIIKWLLENRYEGCSPKGIYYAACYGNLAVLKCINKHVDNMNECDMYEAINVSMEKGHADVAKYLYNLRNDYGRKNNNWEDVKLDDINQMLMDYENRPTENDAIYTGDYPGFN